MFYGSRGETHKGWRKMLEPKWLRMHVAVVVFFCFLLSVAELSCIDTVFFLATALETVIHELADLTYNLGNELVIQETYTLPKL